MGTCYFYLRGYCSVMFSRHFVDVILIQPGGHGICPLATLPVLCLVLLQPSVPSLDHKSSCSSQVGLYPRFRATTYCTKLYSYIALCRVSVLVVLEYCWNVYPSTVFSSLLLHACHVTLLVGLLYCSPAHPPHPHQDKTQ